MQTPHVSCKVAYVVSRVMPSEEQMTLKVMNILPCMKKRGLCRCS